ncbi:hypothetical protein [Ktedonospora formicarum]|uniref:hypothetical protein n=1 Tax=Ktedonospora formicarum TaxID=2778364 RepID=UPI001C693AFD|nr:hypothetical protein [Ktedonospora formicarum]
MSPAHAEPEVELNWADKGQVAKIVAPVPETDHQRAAARLAHPPLLIIIIDTRRWNRALPATLGIPARLLYTTRNHT